MIFLCIFHLFLLRYYCVLYAIYSLILLCARKIVVYISCLLFIPLLFHHPHWPMLTLVNLQLFFWIHHLVVAYIETHVFIPDISISHIVDSALKFSVAYSYWIISSLFIFNNLRHIPNFTFILLLIKYKYFISFHPFPHMSPICDTNNKVRCLNILFFRSRGFFISIVSIDKYLKQPHLLWSLVCRCCFNTQCIFLMERWNFQDGIPIRVVNLCLLPRIVSRPRVESSYPQEKTAGILTQKDGGSFA